MKPGNGNSALSNRCRPHKSGMIFEHPPTLYLTIGHKYFREIYFDLFIQQPAFSQL
jgi:hypothetical protein